METLDKLKPPSAPQHPGLGKPLHREALRRLPLPEKVRIVVELQKIAAPILRARGQKPVVWKIEEEGALLRGGKEKCR